MVLKCGSNTVADLRAMMHLPDQNDRSPVIGVRSRFIYLYSFTFVMRLMAVSVPSSVCRWWDAWSQALSMGTDELMTNMLPDKEMFLRYVSLVNYLYFLICDLTNFFSDRIPKALIWCPVSFASNGCRTQFVYIREPSLFYRPNAKTGFTILWIFWIKCCNSLLVWKSSIMFFINWE